MFTSLQVLQKYEKIKMGKRLLHALVLRERKRWTLRGFELVMLEVDVFPHMCIPTS